MQNKKSITIAVHASVAELAGAAMDLARELSIPLAQSETGPYEFLLLCSPEGLSLTRTGKNAPAPVMVDFTSPTMTYRIRHGGGRKQALARAVGLKKGWRPSVIDATAGLGRDAFVLACLGCHVHMLERSPLLAAMLTDGLKRARRSGHVAEIINEGLRFTHADSMHYLHKLQPQDFPEVIYLDPMYPERAKSSLVKKEMRLLRELAGDDLDAVELLAIALQRARHRVVVKRPRLATPLGDIPPSHQITGKTSRFDVHLI